MKVGVNDNTNSNNDIIYKLKSYFNLNSLPIVFILRLFILINIRDNVTLGT